MPTGVYVRTPKPLADPLPRFWKWVYKTEGCWFWIGDCYPDGYGRFWQGGTNHRAARWLLGYMNGGIPPGMHVLHSCDTPTCVRPDHLSFGTGKENSRQQVMRGRQWAPYRLAGVEILRGERIGRSKLKEPAVKEIRRVYAPGTAGESSPTSLRGLAREYGVSKYAIFAIVHRLTWTHI